MDPFHPYEYFYVLDLEEQLLVLEGMTARAVALGQDAVVTVVTQAMAPVKHARDMKAAWDQAQLAPVARQDLRGLDANIDLLLRAGHDTMAAAEINPVHPFAAQARALRSLCFPDGLGAHSQAGWTDQRAKNRDFVAIVQAPEHAQVIDGLHLRPLVDRLAGQAADFAAAMLLDTAVTRAQVDAASEVAALHTRQAIIQVLGMFPWTDPAAVARMDDILTQLRSVYAQIHARSVAKKKAVVANASAPARAASAPETAATATPVTAPEPSTPATVPAPASAAA